jgi:hypothetical protein
MRQIQIRKPVKRTTSVRRTDLGELDLRTPSGRVLPF